MIKTKYWLVVQIMLRSKDRDHQWRILVACKYYCMLGSDHKRCFIYLVFVLLDPKLRVSGLHPGEHHRVRVDLGGTKLAHINQLWRQRRSVRSDWTRRELCTLLSTAIYETSISENPINIRFKFKIQRAAHPETTPKWNLFEDRQIWKLLLSSSRGLLVGTYW